MRFPRTTVGRNPLFTGGTNNFDVSLLKTVQIAERARLEVRCEARELTQRYDDEDEMHKALARARPTTLTFSLEPG